MSTSTKFDWYPGIPARDRWCYGHAGSDETGTAVKVTHLAIVRMIIVEEIDADRLPVRTLTTMDLSGVRADLDATVAAIGIRPGLPKVDA